MQKALSRLGRFGHQWTDPQVYALLKQARADPGKTVASALGIHQGQHRTGGMIQPLGQKVGPRAGLPLGIEALHRLLGDGCTLEQLPSSTGVQPAGRFTVASGWLTFGVGAGPVFDVG